MNANKTLDINRDDMNDSDMSPFKKQFTRAISNLDQSKSPDKRSKSKPVGNRTKVAKAKKKVKDGTVFHIYQFFESIAIESSIKDTLSQTQNMSASRQVFHKHHVSTHDSLGMTLQFITFNV